MIRPLSYQQSEGYRWGRNPKPFVKRSERYKLEHRIIAEKALGKPLPKGVEVHHVNGVRGDNPNSNLVICENRQYHMLLHQRQRAFQACGHADWRKCVICGNYDSPENLCITGNRSVHHACQNAYRKAKGLNKADFRRARNWSSYQNAPRKKKEEIEKLEG